MEVVVVVVVVVIVVVAVAVFAICNIFHVSSMSLPLT